MRGDLTGFSVAGIDDLTNFFDGLADIPDDVTDAMLNAEADVLVEAQKRTARSMLDGPYAQEVVANAAQKKKVQKTSSGKELDITFVGTRGRDKGGGSKTRAGEIAYINEFGTSKQPARKFIETANTEDGDEALASAAEIYHDWQDSL